MTKKSGTSFMQSDRTINRNFIYASLFFTLTFVLLTYPLLNNSVAPIWDALDLIYPAFFYLSESLRDGRFPLWDPFTNCGDPFHSDPNRLTLSPIAQLLAVFSNKPSSGFIAYWLLHWWLGGCGMLWLARRFGAEPIGALIAAFTYAFSGFFIGHGQHTTFIVIAAFLPWIIGLSEISVSRRKISYAILAGATFGFCAIDGGYPGLIAMAGIALAFWLILHHLLSPDKFRSDTLNKIKWIFITLIIVGAILLIAWSPYLNAFFVEAAGFTDRVSSLGYNEAIYGNPFTYKALLSLLFPFSTILFSNLTNIFHGENWMGADLSMTNAYFGILGIPLVWVWLKGEVGCKRNMWLLIFVAVMFLVSMGGYGGLRTILFYLVSPTRYMRYNAAFRLFWMIPLCMAAGLGFSTAVRSPDARKQLLKFLIPWFIFVAFVALVIGWFPQSRGFPTGEYLPRLLMPGIVILPLATAVVWCWTKSRSTQMDRFFPFILAGLVLFDTAGLLYTNSLTVWDKGKAPIFLQLDNNFSKKGIAIHGEPPSRLAESPTGNINSQQITKIPIVSGYMPYHAYNFNEILVKSRFIEILTAPNRFWLSPGAEPVQSRELALSILKTSGSSSALPVFVESPIQITSDRVVPGSFGGTKITLYAPEEVRLTVNVPGNRQAILTSTERYASGWKVWVDGKLAESLKTNLYFRGVMVPPGDHSVIWRYEPVRLMQLVIVSYATILTSFIWAVIRIRREDRMP